MVWGGFWAVLVGLCFHTRGRNFLFLIVPIFGMGIFVLNFWLGVPRFTIRGMIGGFVIAARCLMTIMG